MGLAGSRSKQMSKQNASPGKPSPRRRWKPRPEQHPRQENQDSQHVLTQPKRNAKFETMFPKVSPKFAPKFLVLSWQLENLPLKFQQSLTIRNFQHQTNVNVTKKSQHTSACMATLKTGLGLSEKTHITTDTCGSNAPLALKTLYVRDPKLVRIKPHRLVSAENVFRALLPSKAKCSATRDSVAATPPV